MWSCQNNYNEAGRGKEKFHDGKRCFEVEEVRMQCNHADRRAELKNNQLVVRKCVN